MRRVVGIDFDNTLVSYDGVIHRAAVERGLIAPAAEANKRAIRDQIRRLPDGEVEWQKIQALVYGPMLREARLIPGVEEFVRRCRDVGVSIYVVSHKTEFASYDTTKTNLRVAALEWMSNQRFFEPGGFGLCPDIVFFDSTREAKIARIRSTGCTHFIDDLEEVFLEPSFPPEVEKILYIPEAGLPAANGVTVCRSWQAVGDYFFGNNP